MAARLLAAGGGTAAAAAAVTTAPAGEDHQAGPDTPPGAPVIACEVFPPMQNLARRVIARNGLAEVIRVVNKRSDEIVVQQPGEAAAKQAVGAAAARAARAAAAAGTAAAAPDMYGRADVIVTEIFDSELLGEGMIPTMRHAVQHLLKDGGVVIPAISRVYGQLVQCPLMHNMTAAAADRVLGALSELDAGARTAFYCSEDFYEVREMHVDLLYQHDKIRKRLCSEAHPESHVDGSSSDGSSSAHSTLEQQQQPEQQQPLLQPLSEPFLVLDFDWLRPPPPAGRRTVCEVPVTQAGSAHAVLLWWQLGMTPPPPPPPPPPPLPPPQEPPQPSTDDAQVQQPEGGATSPPRPPPLLLSTSPEWLQGRVEAGGDGGPLQGVEQQWRDHWKQCWVQALLQLGDRDRLISFAAALRTALEEATRLPAAAAAAASGGTDPSAGDAAAALNPGGAEVVVVDGSMSLGLLAASHPGVASVTLLKEDNLSAQNWLRAAAKHLDITANKIKSIRSETYFKRLRASAGATGGSATPSAAAAGQGPLVLISEPYFSEFEQLVPWAHLKFWRDYDVIRGSPAARAGRRVVGFPRAARLVAVAAALPELWRTRCALGDVEGLDLSAANAVLGVVGAPAEAEAEVEAAAGVQSGADSDDDVWGDEGSGDDAERVGDGANAGKVRQPLPILPYSVWQAGGGYQELSARQELFVLDCDGHLNDVEGNATLTVTHGSVCHAVVLWLEYDLGPSAASAAENGTAGQGRLVVSTAPAKDGGPTATVQGVYLLRQPVEVTHGSRLHVTAQFDGLDADVGVDVTVLPPLT
ncbi:hypothetical protein VOLCADRAFT_104892 [Volvox carteri f. nagariensis]|uniref:type I protein arginine methyltransferase n=1 Tax=Volvox carteri f. nagariensis TaxID=3068 RepID=D8TWU9_VOLCA|nr:uncharacterized protein VOLCADRAFT_104892 [Volvox carteri f. nagariensis]EFJ48213.1 hypothetical protein VOLCADRAFT_104892 [Volvox carteri f. nagariensis]|eukprot:XP_002950898.1 hypothetical protein VOLCADRAFT_104892 [Volvox carteri f. nagariensis]